MRPAALVILLIVLALPTAAAGAPPSSSGEPALGCGAPCSGGLPAPQETAPGGLSGAVVPATPAENAYEGDIALLVLLGVLGALVPVIVLRLRRSRDGARPDSSGRSPLRLVWGRAEPETGLVEPAAALPDRLGPASNAAGIPVKRR